jgi:hypothetical protein
MKNIGVWLRDISENFDKGKPGSERRKTGQAPKLVKVIVSPMLALPNAVVTISSGEDIYGNDVSSAQRWIGAPISAALFLFPTQITTYLGIPEVSVYIIDPLINKSLE